MRRSTAVLLSLLAIAAPQLARAETLFQARRWTHARASYQKVRPFVAEADREVRDRVRHERRLRKPATTALYR